MGEEILGNDEIVDEPKGDTALTGEEPTEAEKAEAVAKAAADEKVAAKEGDDTDHDTDDKSKDGLADDDKDGAPEEYSDFTLPEGMELDAKLLAEATPLLKDLGATQEQAQKLIDFQTKTLTDFADAQTKAWTDQLGEWKTARENDAEYGKGKYDASLAAARSAMRTIGGTELVTALEETGMGNHPEMIRVFYRLSKVIGEDTLNFGEGSVEGGKTLADKLFPNQGKAA